MKIALAQQNYHIGNLPANTEKIVSGIEKAKTMGAELVVFSELAVCGYIPHDLLEQRDFVEETLKAANSIALHCTGITAIVGCPTLNTDGKGKHLYNSALVMADGKIVRRIHKTLLPTYDIFDEYRYFEPNHKFELYELGNIRFAITICEDLWDEQHDRIHFVNEALYKISPMQQLCELGAQWVINIAGSPFSYNQADARRKILERNASRYNIPIVYVNQVGAQTEIVFDGGSQVLNASGQVVKEMAYFGEDFATVDTESIAQIPAHPARQFNKTEIIHDALILGIRDYFAKMRFSKAILGLSGGIDSAVTLALASKALGNENLHALLMPSPFSSAHSINDSVDMATRLNISYDIIRIDALYEGFLTGLHPVMDNSNPGLTGENLQARIRGVLLMAYSNKNGHILLNTSNKSEAAVGYSTLYGDMNGGISVLGDVYKTDVYALAEYLNTPVEIIPRNIIEKVPSAELRPNQKDSDSLPEYPLLDAILFEYIENKKSMSEICSLGFSAETVQKVLHLVNNSEYKRFQAPPIIRVSSKAFGFGRRMPLVAKY